MMMRLGRRACGVMKVPLWQADTTSDGRPLAAALAQRLVEGGGDSICRPGRRKKPLSSPWLVM